MGSDDRRDSADEGDGALARTVRSADGVAREPVAVEEPRVGDVLGGRYELLGELGRGGEGVVYRARDRTADVEVALKLLGHTGQSEQSLARFRRELRLARKVTDPRVVRIYDLVELPGRLGLSMELVVGEALSTRLARGPIEDPRALARLAHDLCRALAAAHEGGVTHRDLKPANVMLREGGGALVTDFGVSRLHGSREAAVAAPQKAGSWPAALTQEGTLVGTPAYMAPEQLVGQTDIGPTADVYALGLVLFQAATGRLPEDDFSMPALAIKRLRDPAPPLASLRPDLEPAFCAFVDRCLSIAAGDRFADGAAALAALTEITPSLPATDPSSTQERRTGRGRSESDVGRVVIDPLAKTVLAQPLPTPPKRRRPWGLLAVAIVVLSGVGVFALRRLRKEPPLAPSLPSASTPASARPARFAVTNPRRITFAAGCEEFPVFTLDDKRVLFDATVGPDSHLFVLDLADNTQRQLTNLPGWSFAPDLSPDGKTVAFLRYTEQEQGIWLVPFDGSAPPKHLVPGSGRPGFAADGKGVWAGTQTTRTLHALDGKVLRSLDIPTGYTPRASLELPSGQVVVNFPMVGQSHAGIALYEKDGTRRFLFDGPTDESLVAHPDGRHVLVTREYETGAPELLALPIAGGPPQSLQSEGITPRKGLRFSHDQRQIAWSTCTARTLLAKVVVEGSASRIADLEHNVEWDDRRIACAPTRRETVLLSSRGGNFVPWWMAPGEPPRRLDAPPSEALFAALSPVGENVVATTTKGLVVLAGSAPPRVLTTDGSDTTPAFSRDGATVLFTRRKDGHTRVLSIALAGGATRDVVGPDARDAVASPVDARLVFLAGADGDQLTPTVLEADGKRRVLSAHLPPARYGNLAFSPDGLKVAVANRMEVVEVEFATGKILRRHSAGADVLESACYSKDALWLTHGGWAGDLWLASFTPR
ncbi:MAG: serine/threonine-protein kinase [Myxococcales bacterium]|nr:serine/threonine-protein kinase [Myxococcales bacterium]